MPKQKCEKKELLHLGSRTMSSRTRSAISTSTTATSKTILNRKNLESYNQDGEFLNLLNELDNSFSDTEPMRLEEEKRGYLKSLQPLLDIDTISDNISMSSIVSLKVLDSKPAWSTRESLRKFFPNIDMSDGSSEQPSEYSDLIILESILEKEAPRATQIKVEDEEVDIFNELTDLCATDSEQKTEVDFEAWVKQTEAIEVRQQVSHLIDGLIKTVIEKQSNLDYNSSLKKNLDKRKMVQECFEMYKNYKEELRYSNLLNLKVKEHFKRNKQYTFLRERDPKHYSFDKKKYYLTLTRLDEQLSKERNLQASVSHTAGNLRKELKGCRMKLKSEIQTFEDLVWTTLLRGDHAHLSSNIKNSLSEMSKYRQQIRNVRFRLILEQHSEMQLLKKLQRIDTVADGLTSTDFNNILNQNQSINEKIKERDIEMERVERQKDNIVHSLAHLKEKNEILHNTVARQRSDLKILRNELCRTRKYVYKLDLKRNRIQKEIRNITFKAGLLYKPALLCDYDMTVKSIHEYQATIDCLRQTVNTLTQKLAKLDKFCNDKSL